MNRLTSVTRKSCGQQLQDFLLSEVKTAELVERWLFEKGSR
jgi:hypothetical protein